MRYLLLTLFLTSTLAACATTAQNEKYAETASTRIEGNNLVVKEKDLYDEERDAELAESEKDKKIVCQKPRLTGTNIYRAGTICKTRGEWRRDKEHSQTALQRWNNRSHQKGN